MNTEMKEEFTSRLYKDKEFLKSCNLMDYSLLLIIFKRKGRGETEQSSIMKRTVI